MNKTALVTGINGMDGSHLAELLLKKGYNVYGLERRSSNRHRENLQLVEDEIQFLSGDVTDQNSLLRALQASSPDEVYNLAAQSFVKASFDMPEQTSDVTGMGVLRMLEAIREYDKPVGVAKLYGHWMTKNYRESYDMFNVNGILFNHESERRGIEFVTRKISDGVAKIKLGLADSITLGNLDAERDWGYSPDYVEAMWLMLQQDKPNDYVIATGIKHSIRDFLDVAFNHIGIPDWSSYIKQDPKFMRPAEVDMLVGDSSKAKEQLGWEPKTNFNELVKIMVDNDLHKNNLIPILDLRHG